MNYNNKPKPAQANLLENRMMSTQKNHAMPVSRSGGLALWLPLRRMLFVGLLAIAAPVAVYAGAAEGGMRQSDTPSTPSQPTRLNTQPQPVGAVQSDFPTKLETLERDVTTLKKQEEDRQQKEAQTTPLWKMLLFTVLAVLGLAIFYLLLRISTSKQLQERIDQITEQNKVNAREAANLAKKQQEQVKNALLKLHGQIAQLEQKIQQQQSNLAPVTVKTSDPLTDIPMLESELSISKPPLVSIDADDREIMQQAFTSWLANSLTHQFIDFLPKELIRKIEQLGYEIVFAKAGLGLNRMIIDRKPPNKTCMVGLRSANLSLMYCQKKTSQTDDLWRPNTWYKVTIDNPDAADEQTVHQLEELLT